MSPEKQTATPEKSAKKAPKAKSDKVGKTLMEKVAALSLQKEPNGEFRVPPYFKSGDTLKVQCKIKEGEKERIQVFQGYCLRRSGTGSTEIFVVRKESGGIGVERTFLIQSPNIVNIEVIRKGRVARGRLFYLRSTIGKKSRIREKQSVKPTANS